MEEKVGVLLHTGVPKLTRVRLQPPNQSVEPFYMHYLSLVRFTLQGRDKHSNVRTGKQAVGNCHQQAQEMPPGILRQQAFRVAADHLR